jgi:hypothetical protein
MFFMASRFRIRFSVRAMIVFVTLIGAYFGAWEATKKWGVQDLVMRQNPEFVRLALLREGLDPDAAWPNEWSNSIRQANVCTAPVPFVVSEIQMDGIQLDRFFIRRYYLWFFGKLVELPISVQVNESELSE